MHLVITETNNLIFLKCKLDKSLMNQSNPGYLFHEKILIHGLLLKNKHIFQSNVKNRTVLLN